VRKHITFVYTHICLINTIVVVDVAVVIVVVVVVAIVDVAVTYNKHY